MSNTRDLVLHNLLTKQRCTINDLAEAVEINPISVRHHITRLEADGFVTSEEERHGVGRPRRVYFLTDSGMEQFPSRYLDLSIKLIEQLKSHLPNETVGAIFKGIATDLVNEQITEANISNLSLPERMTVLKKLLENEGFNIQINQEKEGFYIQEIGCPYMHVSHEHPEVCVVDQTIIHSILETDVTKTHCMTKGDPFCRYFVPLQSIEEREN